MKKNVVIINGSPRSGGNSDYLAGSLGADIFKGTTGVAHIFHPFIFQFDPCGGCENCVKTGECVLNDDMQKLVEALEVADALIWISPLYFGGITAQLKAVVDRFQLIWSRNVLAGKDGGIPNDRSRPALAFYISAKDDPFKTEISSSAALLSLRYASHTAGFSLVAHHALIGPTKRGDMVKQEFSAQLDEAISFARDVLLAEGVL